MLQKLLENFFRVVLEVSMLKTWLQKFFEADLKVLTYFPNLKVNFAQWRTQKFAEGEAES